MRHLASYPLRLFNPVTILSFFKSFMQVIDTQKSQDDSHGHYDHKENDEEYNFKKKIDYGIHA